VPYGMIVKNDRARIAPAARYSAIPSSIDDMPSAMLPEALRAQFRSTRA
jgi:hypothetical protein